MDELSFSSLLPRSLQELSALCPFPLYVVGGSVRDFLAGFPLVNPDFDICAPALPEQFLPLAGRAGLQLKSVFKATGTAKLTDGTNEFEFASFRSDTYERGLHQPASSCFTTDILPDAKRRDFTANAVYYDIKGETFLDPLGGVAAIREKRLTCVQDAKIVFGQDGLRLMRLCRLAAQTGFTPDADALAAARQNAALLRDIHPQRIWTELMLLLSADQKHGLPDAPYRGLKLLDESRALDIILPELAAGRSMAQRKDFHDHDVLEHSLRCVKYCPAGDVLRLAALLHDVGKPACMLKDGNFHFHESVGAAFASDILARLGAPKRISERVVRLIAEHMYDLKSETKEGKLRRYLVKNADLIDDLLALKQADYSACKDDLSPCPAAVRWRALLRRMEQEGVPMTKKQLAVNGDDLKAAGVQPAHLSRVLDELLLSCATAPSLNRKDRLLPLALATERNLFPEGVSSK